MTTREFDRIYIFEEIGNAENKYVFKAPVMTPCELYELFLTWCSKINNTIKKDIDIHDLGIKMTTVMNELFYSDEFDDITTVPMVIEDSLYVGIMDFIQNPYETDIRTPYFRGELSVRPVRRLQGENDIRHKYQFSLVLVNDIANGFEDGIKR